MKWPNRRSIRQLRPSNPPSFQHSWQPNRSCQIWYLSEFRRTTTLVPNSYVSVASTQPPSLDKAKRMPTITLCNPESLQTPTPFVIHALTKRPSFARLRSNSRVSAHAANLGIPRMAIVVRGTPRCRRDRGRGRDHCRASPSPSVGRVHVLDDNFGLGHAVALIPCCEAAPPYRQAAAYEQQECDESQDGPKNCADLIWCQRR